MKKIIQTISISACGLAIILTTGCSTSVRDNMPVTHFAAFIGGKPCAFDGPKDFKAESIAFRAETNGTVSLVITGIDARINPDVITMTGEAYTKMRDSDNRYWSSIISTATTGGGALIGEAGKAMVKP